MKIKHFLFFLYNPMDKQIHTQIHTYVRWNKSGVRATPFKYGDDDDDVDVDFRIQFIDSSFAIQNIKIFYWYICITAYHPTSYFQHLFENFIDRLSREHSYLRFANMQWNRQTRYLGCDFINKCSKWNGFQRFDSVGIKFAIKPDRVFEAFITHLKRG